MSRTLALVTLRVAGVVDWSWWAVTAPDWGAVGLVLAGAGCVWATALLPRRNPH